MQTHYVVRTNPKGQPFIGTCRLCGRTGLTLREAGGYCENVTGMTDEEALLDAIEGDHRQ